MNPQDWSHIVSASVVPVVIISACGLLCLAFYNRLATIVLRLRAFQRERLQEQEILVKLDARAPPAEPALLERHRRVLEMLAVQTAHVTRRAHLVRNTLFCLLGSIACLVVSSMATGLTLVWTSARYLAAVLFYGGLIALLAGVIYAMIEIKAALDPVELESRFVKKLSEDLRKSRGRQA